MVDKVSNAMNKQFLFLSQENSSMLYEIQKFRNKGSQRLQVAKRLLAGETYDAIRAQLPVSSTTITRINTALHYGAGGYASVLRRLAEGAE